MTMMLLGLVHVEDGHAVDGRGWVAARRRVGHVVGADHEGHVGALELGVDLVHLLELRVGHVRLRQQHVHVARHAPGHRMDGVRDVDAARLEQVGQLAHGVLRLRHGKAVAGHDDDLLGVGQLDGRIVEADLAHAAARARGRGAGARRRRCRSRRP